MASYMLYIFAFVLMFNDIANGLTCNNCNSLSNQPCVPETCPSDPPNQCSKITVELVDGTKVTQRMCLEMPHHLNCGDSRIKSVVHNLMNSQIGTDIVRDVDCDSCSTDMCNSAKKITGMMFITLLVSAFAFLM